MIPKVINYCWFGRNPLPESAVKCINSWKKFLPDYEIKEWNEDNFDVNIIPYTQEAYSVKKYAFVSDYARFWILYNYGGLYFDTDVEVIKPMDDIISAGSFMGMEINALIDRGGTPIINPGLGMGAEPGNYLYKKMLDSYETLSFILPDGSRNGYSMIPMLSEILKKDGIQVIDGIQKIDDITYYPADYFNPLNSLTGELTITSNTRSIHWYTASWASPQPKFVKWAKQMLRRLVYSFKA